ncbi:MAG: hypothetical protein GX275_05950 [Clostridiales bacterium]|nr:hypothetical protein [Clostridiales bacterium]
MELRLIDINRNQYTRIKLSNKKEQDIIYRCKDILGQPIKESKSFTYFINKGDLGSTAEKLGLERRKISI